MKKQPNYPPPEAVRLKPTPNPPKPGFYNKKYWLFVGFDDPYQNLHGGGMDNFKESYDSVESASRVAENEIELIHGGWYQIVDVRTAIIVKEVRNSKQAR